MTLYQFNVLTESEKTAIVWSKGDFVIERKENNFSILRRLRSFSSTEQLEPYLEKINISGLIT